MSSKPSSSENTIQADVGPGDKTGIYYITICNLPFGSSWQELKDWLRQACTVDHIELFQTSTSGWIRLRGKDNFEKAWKHINSVDFKGRSIIASDKNRTESIKIKELVESSTHSKSERVSPAPRVPYLQTTPPTRYEPQHASTQYSAASYGQVRVPSTLLSRLYPARTLFDNACMPQFYMHGYLQSNAGVSYSAGPVAMPTYNATPAAGHHRTLVDPYAAADPWTTYSTGTGHGIGYGEQPPAIVGSTSRSPYEGVQYTMPYRTRPAATSYTNAYNNTAESVSSNEYIQTEPRKILVRQLSQRASPEEITAWIQGKTGKYAQEISYIEVPPNDNKNRVRGHAYIIFKSTSAAQAAVGLLDKAVFHSRQISARFTREGVASDERASTSVITPPTDRKDTRSARHDGSRSHRMKYREPGPTSHYGYGNKGRAEKKTKAPEKEIAPLETKEILAPEKKEIKTPEKREGRVERKEIQLESLLVENENKVWPVIADGSSRQRSEKQA